MLRHTLAALILSTLPLAAQTHDAQPHDAQITKSHGIAILGDLALPADFTHLPYVNPDAPKGGTLSQSVPNNSNFDNFNPYTLKGRPAVLSGVMLESLLGRDASDFGASYCLLCETLEYPESRDWVVFTLREGIRFRDGSEMTAGDVVFSVKELRDHGFGGLRLQIAQQIEAVEALDARRVKFTFKPDFPHREVIQFAGGLPVFSKADFTRRGLTLDATMEDPLLGSGPYALSGWQFGRWVEATRNPDYWGRDLPLNRGRHNFDRIRYEYFADYDAAFQAFTAGEYTFRREVSSIKWANSYDFPALQKGWVKTERLADGSSVSGQAWIFNLRREKFQDPRVREAIGLMFNFAWSNENLFYGLYERVNSYWENSKLEATGLPSDAEIALLEPYRDILPAELFEAEPFSWPDGAATPRDRKALRRASKLLDAAGWKMGPNGMRRNAAGDTLRVEILNDGPTFDRVINPFVENLRGLGVDAVNLRVDNAEAQARQRAHDFDMTADYIGQSHIPGYEMDSQFASGFADREDNLLGLQNPAVDGLLRAVQHAQTEEDLTTAVHALDRVLRALRLVVPQWYNPEHLVAYYDQYDHPAEIPPYALGELDFWWYNAEKAETLKEAGALR